MSTKVNEKWSKTFPASIGNQTRPTTGVDDTQAFETGGFPQFIDNDPVASGLQNALMSQAMSNDARLKEQLDAHKKDSAAHAAGISGNAGTATKLKTARNIKLTGKATGSTAFDGTADASINVTAVTADKCVGNSATATKTVATAGNGTMVELVHGTMATNDSFRIAVGGKDNIGWGEIATADEGTEAIKVAQYTGAFAKKVREASLLDTAGNTSFPGKITATNGFSGHLYGKADTAGRADVATSADAVTWGHVTEKPATYPPSAHDHNALYPSTTGARATGTWGISISGNAKTASTADNADKVDGYHETSFFRARAKVDKGGSRNTLWSQIGIKEYNDELPDGISSGYRYGAVASFAGSNSRLDLCYNHQASTNKDGIRYRTGWGTDKKAWQTILDTCNYNNWVPTKNGGGASGTWGISITGSSASCTGNSKTATNVAWSGVTGKPAVYPPAAHNHDTLYPSTGGARATGTWDINIKKNAATATTAAKLGNAGDTSKAMLFSWKGQDGQPTWLWGGNDGTNMLVYNPSNFSVKYAKSAGAVAWANVTGKPATYAPSTHNHDSSYPSTAGARATGTWKIGISGNAATATNADKLDGAHLADIYRHVGGRVQPTMTALMDRVAMCKAANASTADINANVAKINKSPNWTQNIWNVGAGIHAYGGDFGFKNYNGGTILLKQDFRNFDKVLIFFTNDEGNYTHTITWDSWELWWSMQHSWRLDLGRGTNGGGYWAILGSNKDLGTDKHGNRYSSPTVLQGYESCQNCGIIEIYGLNY